MKFLDSSQSSSTSRLCFFKKMNLSNDQDTTGTENVTNSFNVISCFPLDQVFHEDCLLFFKKFENKGIYQMTKLPLEAQHYIFSPNTKCETVCSF